MLNSARYQKIISRQVLDGLGRHGSKVEGIIPGRKAWLPGLLAVVTLGVMVGCTAAQTPTPELSPVIREVPPPTNSPTATAAPTPTPTPPATAPPATVGPGPAATPTPIPTRSPTRLSTPVVDSTAASNTPTPFPAVAPSPTPVSVAEERFPEAPDRDLYELARSLVLKTEETISRTVNPDPVSYAEGRQDPFWMIDITEARVYKTQATLRLVSPHAYWYVEVGLDISRSDLEEASEIFEQEIYPRVTAAFGTEWTPGVDNDPHLTILHAYLAGAAGYFSSVDEYPTSIQLHSNQREMFYMSDALRVNSTEYLAVLSHELQHAIHWNGDATEETWVNEGLSEVASAVAGYSPAHRQAFLRSPTTSLVDWPLTHSASPNYGAAFLFLDYLSAHYGSRADLASLVQDPLDGIPGINAYLSRLGYDVTFRGVFKDWVVANYLDEPGDGPYSYPDQDVRARVTGRMGKFGERESSIPQYSAEYTAIDLIEGDIIVRFQGQRETALLPVPVDEDGCWWSNRGDSVSSTLTRPLDLSDVGRATLTYRVWFDVEEDWDYGYVEVSNDDGSTWDILEPPRASTANPVGNSYGPGYTGSSNGWLDESVDLTPYSGQRVLVRFHYVTDDAINGAGLCFDDISVPEIGFSDDVSDGGWRSDGFFRTDNLVPQDYIVQVIAVGDGARVRQMVLDDEHLRGEIVIRDLENLEDVVLVVAALAPKTLQEATYTLTLAPAS